MSLLKKATAYTRMFLMVDTADHITGKTGLTVAVAISKAGATFASAAGTVTEVANGWYKVAYTTADTSADGDLAAHCTSAGADPTDFVDQVVEIDLNDAVRLGITALPNAAAGANGGLPTGDASGKVQLQADQAVNVTKVGGTAQTAGDLGAEVAAIKVQTDKLAFTVANQIDANVIDWKGAAAPAMTGDAFARLGAPAGASTAADIAAVKVDTAATRTAVGTAGAGLTALGDTRIAFLDEAVSTRLADADYSDPPDAAAIRAAVGLASANLDTQIGTLATATTAAGIKSKTDNLPSDPADASDVAAGITALASHGDSTWATAAGIAALSSHGDGAWATADVSGVPSADDNADALLNRDMSAGADDGSTTDRTVRNALRFLRNRWTISGTTLTVYKENDTDVAWTAVIATNAGQAPVVGSNPAG